MSEAPSASLSYAPQVVHPAGATLAEWLERQGMSQAEFARRVGLSTKHINQIVNGGVGLSADVAVAFETVTSIPVRLWTQLDASHRASEARRHDDLVLETQVGVLNQFPIKEMERRGYFPEVVKSRVAKLRSLLQFFGVANVSALEAVVARPAALRPSKAFKPNEAALAAWLRRAEHLAADVATRPFDAESCTAALAEFRALTTTAGLRWLQPLKDQCADVGIALIVEPELPGCRINGATRWLSPERAMVALSMRHRRHDIFWFTLFHEVGHLLRHSKRQTFVDAAGMGVPDHLERDADRFAGRLLIPMEHEGELRDLTTQADVVAFSRRIGISPAIVVGRMQHERLIPHNQWNDLIPRYKFPSS